MLSTVASTTEPLRPVSKVKEPRPTADAAESRTPAADPPTPATNDTNNFSVNGPVNNAVTGLTVDGEVVSPLWAILRRLKPLPTADNSAVYRDRAGSGGTTGDRSAVELAARGVQDGTSGVDPARLPAGQLCPSQSAARERRAATSPTPSPCRQILPTAHGPGYVAAGLLHDVAEDTEFDIDYIVEQFGDSIASLVDGVTKLKTHQ